MGGGSTKVQQSPAEQAAAKIMQQQYAEWAPILGSTGQTQVQTGTEQQRVWEPDPYGNRAEGQWVMKDVPIYGQSTKSGLLGDIWDIQQGIFDPQKSPTYRPQFNIARQSIDQGYRGALDNILSNTKPGGAQTQAIADMFRARGEDTATAQWGLEDSIIKNLQSLAQSSATGTPWQASSGLTQLGQIQAQRALANAQQSAGEKSALGQAAGGVAQGIGYSYGVPAGGKG